MSDESAARDALDVLGEHDRFYSAVQALARINLEQTDMIEEYVREWSDEDILDLIRHLEGPELQKGLGHRVTFWDDAAKILRARLDVRRMCARAEEVGQKWYCPTCDGVCESEEKHDENAARLHPPVSEAEMRLNELSRDRLIELLLSCEGSWAL